MCAMPIGELSLRTDTPVATIRYYEELGVMPVPARSAAGRRLYGVEDVARLDFIRSRRVLGYSLKDIAGALVPATNCVPNLGQARAHLLRLQDEIARLGRLAEALAREIATCENDCSDGPRSRCLVLPG
jgi:DNA-binding transcriptional MerR regulator